METQVIDKQSFRKAFIELMESDKNFISYRKEILMFDSGLEKEEKKTNEIISTDSKPTLYKRSISSSRKKKQNSLKSRYESQNVVNTNVIYALQAEFKDAPSAEEMIKML